MIKSFFLSFLILLSFFYSLSTQLEVGANKEFKNISDALASSNPGDTIYVFEGLYKEGTILINKRLSFIGINYPVIDGENKYETIQITADSVIISGFVIKNIGISYIEDRSAIRLIKSKNSIIKENRLENAFFGIYLEKCKNIIVENNTITGNAKNEMSSGNAIHLWYCKNITIKSNNIQGHRDGIYLEFVDNSNVEYNYVTNNIRYGLHFMFSNNNIYLNNQFISNGAGVAVMFSKNILMANNTFANNWGSSSYGLLLKDITDSEIKYNRFFGNTTGIYAEGVNRVLLHNNDIEKNGWALKILGSCADNIISANNFVNNSFDVSTNTRNNLNTYSGNYWSENTSIYDLNKDGIGDVPYRPVKLFSFLIANMPSTTILMRSPLISLVNYAEKIVPVITPANLVDDKPMMNKIDNDTDKRAG